MDDMTEGVTTVRVCGYDIRVQSSKSVPKDTAYLVPSYPDSLYEIVATPDMTSMMLLRDEKVMEELTKAVVKIENLGGEFG